MATGLGRLTVDFVMRTAGYEEGMTRAERITQRKAREMQRNITRVSVAITGAATAARAYAQQMINVAAQSIDATLKMARQIGTTTEALTGMRYAAQQFASVSSGNFDLAIRRMTRRISDAAQGGGAAASAIKALGLSAADLARMDMADQFKTIADAMAQIDDGGKRLIYTMALFDTQGMPLVSALEQGGDELQRMVDKAQELGYVLSTADALVIEEYTTATANFSAALEALARRIVVGLAPALTDMAKDSTDFVHNLSGAAETAATVIEKLTSVAQIGAVVIGARLAGAAAAATAQILAKSAASTIAVYQALRLQTASTAAAAGLTALAVAGRAAYLTMTLFGGVAGLIIAALGYSYIQWRNNAKAVEQYKGVLDTLNGSIDNVSSSLAKMTKDQQRATFAAAQANVIESRKLVEKAIQDAKDVAEQAMFEGFRGSKQEMQNFRTQLEETLRGGGSVHDLIMQIGGTKVFSQEAINSMVEFSANADTNRVALSENQEMLLEVARALEGFRLSAEGAAGGVRELSQELINAQAEGAKYAESLADRLITAGLTTEVQKLDAMVAAGKIAFATQEELNKARSDALKIDARVAAGRKTSGGKNNAAEQEARAVQTLIDALLPAQKISKDYERDQNRLNAALNSGKVSANQYNEAQAALDERRRKALDGIIPEEIKRMQELERTAEQGINNYIKQQERLLENTAKSESAIELATALAEVEDKYQRIAEQMAASSRGVSDEELEKMRDYMEQELELVQHYHDRKMELNESWLHGMELGLQQYIDSVGNTSEQVASLMMSAFGHAENALFDLITTGKVDLRALVQNLASDVIRMMIRMGLQMAANFAMAKAFGAASAATAAATGSAMATAYAPAAAMASLASFGANAAPASAGITSTVMLAQGLSFAGMFDDGGVIPAGQWGIVGEIGPEIVHGPANVTSRADTARLLGAGGKQTVVQVIESRDRAGETETIDNGEEEVTRIFVSQIRNNGSIMQALTQSTNVTYVGS